MIEALNSVEIKIEDPYLNEIGGLPSRGTPGSAGYDVRACIHEELTIYAGGVSKVPTGFSVNIKDPHWSLWFLPRSGLGVKGLILANGTGLLDSDYQGQAFLPLWNRNETEPMVIKPGERVGQMVFVPVGLPELVVVDEFAEKTVRGSGGFGSTGT